MTTKERQLASVLSISFPTRALPDRLDETNECGRLLAQQKANIKGKAPGASLLGRIARPTNNSPSHPAAKTKPQSVRLSSGTDKVGRAKGKANGNGSRMEVDQEVKGGAKGKERPKVKTEAELNEEMRLWERERRFA